MFSNSVKLLSIKGFGIRIDPSWLVIAALVTWSLSRSFFPQVFPDADASTYLAMALLGMLGLFASLLLHELAHSVVARRSGVPVKNITLFIFGGMAELEAEPSSAGAEFRIAIAGPLMSLALAAGFRVLSGTASLLPDAAALAAVLHYLSLVNLVLALFNLVPAFPLDGGRVLRAYLWHRSGDILGATRRASGAGVLFGYVLMALGVLALFQGAVVTGLWQLMIGAFVLIAARASYTQQLARATFDGKTVETLMTANPVTVGPDLTLSTFVNQIVLEHTVSFVPVVEENVLLGHIDTAVLSRIDRENWSNTRVGDVFVGLDPTAMVPPDLPVTALLDRINTTGRRKFMVVADHELCGVITLADLAPHLGDTGSGDASGRKTA
jgi:Zn-dependent protease